MLRRNIFYHSFKNYRGIGIFNINSSSIYILLWGTRIITKIIISLFPYIGNTIVLWIRGGFSINNAILNRFFESNFDKNLITSIFFNQRFIRILYYFYLFLYLTHIKPERYSSYLFIQRAINNCSNIFEKFLVFL